MLRNLGNSVYVKKSNLTLRLLASSHHQTTSIWSLCHCKYYSKKNSTASVDYYKILGISPKATQKQIKQKFYELSKQLHPDRVQSIKADTDAFVKVKLAYEILSDVKARAKFDQYRLSPEKQSKSYDEWSQYATETARPYHNVRTSGVHGMEFEETPKEQSAYTIYTLFDFITLSCIALVFGSILRREYKEYKYPSKPTFYNRQERESFYKFEPSPIPIKELPKNAPREYHHWSHDNKMTTVKPQEPKKRKHKTKGKQRKETKNKMLDITTTTTTCVDVDTPALGASKSSNSALNIDDLKTW